MDAAKIFRVGTRSSPLALRQAEEALGYLKDFYPGIRARIIGMDARGDKDKITPISEMEGTDFFTAEIDQALLAGDIDFGVHSAKDLADEIPAGLCVCAITRPIDAYDALVAKNNLKLKELPYQAKIGTSSQRRKTQIKAYRDDFRIMDIRGTIQERLRQLETTDLDAIIVAACALIRLGLEARITEQIPLTILRPHPLQGALAIVAREEDADLIGLLSRIDARQTLLA